MWRINGGAVPPENRVSIYESTHASLDCPQSDWRVHQRATTAGLTYISLTHRHTGRHTHNCQCFCYIFVWSGKGSETTSGSTEDTKNSKWNPEICSGVSTLQGRESNFTNLMGNSGITTSTHLTVKWRQVQTHNLNQNQDTAVYIVTAMAGLVRYYDKGHREVWFFLEFVYILW